MSTLVVQTTVELFKFVETVNSFVDSLVRTYNKILRLMFFLKMISPGWGVSRKSKKQKKTPEPLRIKMIPQETSIY